MTTVNIGTQGPWATRTCHLVPWGIRPGEWAALPVGSPTEKRIILYETIILVFQLFLLYAQSVHETFLIIFVQKI